MSHPRSRPTQAETTERLLDGAMAAFAERGYHGARIQDICLPAGLTQGAFYARYTSKSELFFALYDRVADKAIEDVDQVIEALPNNVSDPLAAATDAYSHLPRSGREWYLLNTEFALSAVRDPVMRAKYVCRRDAYRQRVLVSIERLFQRTGWSLTVDQEVFVRALIALAEGNLAQSLVEPDQLGPSDLLRHFGRPLLRRSSVPAGVAEQKEDRVASPAAAPAQTTETGPPASTSRVIQSGRGGRARAPSSMVSAKMAK